MNKVEQYKKQNPKYKMHLVDKTFGKGNLLIKFFYREQIRQFKQGFLAYVDTHKWENNHHAVMQEVENYLIETEGIVEKSNFSEDGFDCCIKISNMNYCEKHEKEFYEWFEDQFPKIDLEYGGACHFGVALS